MDLSEFLLARIAEDEAVARRLGDQGWLYHGLRTDGLADPESKLQHSDRWMPSRVLAECEAKRGLLALADPYDFADDGGNGMSEHADEIHRLLALPYADHPDYDPAWRP